MRMHTRTLEFLALVASVLGCSANGPGTDFTGSPNVGGNAGTNTVGSGGGRINTGQAGGLGLGLIITDASYIPDDVQMPGIYVLPTGFTQSTKGGYKLGPPFSSQAVQMDAGVGAGGCGGAIVGVARDFKVGSKQGGHPDFETFTGAGEKNIVQQQLGPDQKPVYNDVPHKLTTTKANFDQWYRNVSAVNQPYLVYLVVEPNGNLFTFDSDKYFPLDDPADVQGWGNEGMNHNFSFTSEFHTSFKYSGGETFSFRGDDDVWVFINNKLVIDLGGLHSAQMQSVMLDTLGLTAGQEYSFDLFHAERHSTESNFRIDTNLAFVNCGVIVRVN